MAVSATLAAIAATAPLTAASPPSKPSPATAGGWSPIESSARELEPVIALAVHRLPRRHARVVRVVEAGQQVVAGMNYRATLALADRSRWRATVWRKLDGTMDLTELAGLRR